MSLLSRIEVFKFKDHQKLYAEKQLTKMVEIHDESELLESLDNYLNKCPKPVFNFWLKDWKKWTPRNEYKDPRCTMIINNLLTVMSQQLQYHQLNNIIKKNPDYDKIAMLEVRRFDLFNPIENYQQLNDRLEYFEITKSGKINVKKYYEVQFLDCVFEKLSERVKPDQVRIAFQIGLENILSVYVSNYYHDMKNWIQPISTAVDYPLHEIVDSVLSSRELVINSLSDAIRKVCK